MAIIPGQSLTAEPKNAPYENPPQMTEPEEAVFFGVFSEVFAVEM